MLVQLHVFYPVMPTSTHKRLIPYTHFYIAHYFQLVGMPRNKSKAYLPTNTMVL